MRCLIKINLLKRFCNSFELLKKLAGSDVKLYIENNVLSKANFNAFSGINPLMFTDVSSFLSLSKKLDFNILLDLAHFKSKCK